MNKDTLKFFSISSRPGNFGATIYNSLFAQYGHNAVYLPMQLPEEQKLNFPRVVNALNALGVSGISVSMPYKRLAAQCSKPAFGITNVNTMIPYGATFKSYNTDVKGFEAACADIIDKAPPAHIAGHGCVAHSIGLVLTRHRVKYKMFSVRDGMDTDLQADWLINATPVGMSGVNDTLYTEEVLKRYKYVFDVVVRPPNQPSNLQQLAEKLNMVYVPGYMMSMHQLIQQYATYAERYDLDTTNLVGNVMDEMRKMGYEIPSV